MRRSFAHGCSLVELRIITKRLHARSMDVGCAPNITQCHVLASIICKNGTITSTLRTKRYG